MNKKQARIGWITVIALAAISLGIGVSMIVTALGYVGTEWWGGPLANHLLVGGIVVGLAIPIALIGGFAFCRAGGLG
jgi:hypothetical protein